MRRRRRRWRRRRRRRARPRGAGARTYPREFLLGALEPSIRQRVSKAGASCEYSVVVHVSRLGTAACSGGGGDDIK